MSVEIINTFALLAHCHPALAGLPQRLITVCSAAVQKKSAALAESLWQGEYVNL